MKRKQVKIWEDKSGASLVIALILSSIVMIITLNQVSIMTRLLEFTSGAQGYAMARYAADSGIELGLGAAYDKGPGWELASATSPMTYCFSPDGTSFTRLGPVPSDTPCPSAGRQKVQYWITGSAEDMDPGAPARYIVPPPGEGSAGENCERIDNYNDPDQSVDENIVKPCNWNKLHFGETVNIPLYGIDASGNPINPPDLPDGSGPGLNSLTVKIRTPCVDNPYDSVTGYLKGRPDAEESEWCTSSDPVVVGVGPDARPDMEDTTSGGGDPTDIIVNWQILGDCDYGPDNSNDGVCVGLAVFPPPNPPLSGDESDINIVAINAGKGSVNIPYSVLGNGTLPLTRNMVNDLNTTNLPFPHEPISTILSYLTLTTTNQNVLFSNTTSRTLNEPYLTLSVVSPLTAGNSQGQVPYLEYQLEVDQPIADSFWTVHSRGSYGNYQLSRKAKKQNSTSIIEFVFQN